MFDPMLSLLAQGLADLPWWGLVLAVLGLTHITIVSVTVFLHRHQAHRALDLHPAVSHFFRFWLWLTTGMVTAEWVAIHRKHHARCETEDDPHSPNTRGIGTVLWRGAELYRAEAENPETLARFSQGTPDDALERHLYRRFPMLGVSLMLLIDLALFGVIGLTVWAVQMLWIPIWAAGVINGLGHWWGYRNFESADLSTNIVPLGLIIGGEELHNNHHAFPGSAKLSSRRWEFDIGWFYIRLLEILGLAAVNKTAPMPRLDPAKQALDVDTVRAVVRNRLHVMSDYARQVMLPVLREEWRSADRSCRRLLRRARKALVRNETLLDARSESLLQRALNERQRLQVVYDFKRRLTALWAQRPTSHEQMLVALQDWCAQAEATGIQALQQFARRLRCYSLPQPA